MEQEEADLQKFWESYRSACPDIEPSPEFMPSLWKKIEARESFWEVFGSFGRVASWASAVVCLLLLALNLIPALQSPSMASTYTDALADDHSAEKTSYAEAIASDRHVPPHPAFPGR